MSDEKQQKSDFQRAIERQTPQTRAWDVHTLGVVGPRKQRTEIGKGEYMTVKLSADGKMLTYTNEKTGESITVPVDGNEPMTANQRVHVTYDEDLVMERSVDPVNDGLKRVFGHPVTPWIIAFFPALLYVVFTRVTRTAEANPGDARALFGVLMIAWTMSNAFYAWRIGDLHTGGVRLKAQLKELFTAYKEKVRVLEGRFESHVTGADNSSVGLLREATRDCMEKNDANFEKLMEFFALLHEQVEERKKFTERVLELNDWCMQMNKRLEKIEEGKK